MTTPDKISLLGKLETDISVFASDLVYQNSYAKNDRKKELMVWLLMTYLDYINRQEITDTYEVNLLTDDEVNNMIAYCEDKLNVEYNLRF